MLSLTYDMLFSPILFYYPSLLGMFDMVHPAALAMATGGDDIMGVISPGMTGAAALCAAQHVWKEHLNPMIEGVLKTD